MTRPRPASANRPNSALLAMRAGRFRMSARVRMTTCGLWAVGGLVSMILLSTAALVDAAGATGRRRHARRAAKD